MKNKRLILPLLFVSLLASLLFPMNNVKAVGEKEKPQNISAKVNGNGTLIKAVTSSYDNNLYLSLRDLANALSGSNKQFDVSVGGSEVNIVTGRGYGARGGENEPFDEEQTAPEFYFRSNLNMNKITVDDREIKRYTHIIQTASGVNDCFMSATEVGLTLDINMSFTGDTLEIDTGEDFSVNLSELMEGEYFTPVRSFVLGDATTGEVIYEMDGDENVFIASTSKLMTYLCVMDAISNGEIGEYDEVPIKEGALRLSNGDDAVINFEEGQVSNVPELIRAMLLASSNESAMALAEYVSGSEAEFAERMNKKAHSIGMSEATEFFNASGLPTYTKDLMSAKRQNKSTAEDMFKLVRHILSVYPQILDVTSLKYADVPTLGTTVKNTNHLLYNVPDAVGLKTGTTGGALCCLVGAKEVSVGDGEHILVSLVFGADDNAIRTVTSEVLLKYGTDWLQDKRNTAKEGEKGIPTGAEELIQLILKKQN